MSLWEQLTEPPAIGKHLYTWQGDSFAPTSWQELVADAHRKAFALRRIGVGPGSRVACVLTNSEAVPPSILAIWLAGGTIVSLPVPARGMEISEYLAQLRRLCERSEANLLLLEQRFASALEGAAAGLRVAAYESLEGGAELGPEPPDEDQVAFVQYSSGTTGEPRGCMLTANAIADQVGMLIERLDADARHDRGVSWLPLSHDMGLFGALMLAWTLGADLALGTPERFLVSPQTWAQDCADFSATITVGPNFGLAVASRAAAIAPPDARLSVRAWIVGSDRIEWESLQAALDTLGPAGLTREALVPAYGLAEATLAVTMVPPGRGPRTLAVDSAALLDGGVLEVEPGSAEATLLVSSGRPVQGTAVRVSDELLAAEAEGSGRADGSVPLGEICVRSPSLAVGYVGEPERSAAHFRDGELRTDDLGFIGDGEVYVLGRGDDMLAAGGRNIHAGELEALFSQQPGVRAGACALVEVGEGDHGRLVVFAEAREEVTDFEGLAEAIRKVAAARSGVRVEEFAFLARGTLPKSPSGKVQRYRCRQLLDADEARIVRRVRL
jgi:acyl-CoA synthetase (AMP-forming)/AMP-acid ligase II